jgi:spoIIIJ-associated protein
MRRHIETSAKTPEEAIELALRELDAERAEVEIDVVSRGKAGFMGIGSEPARVRVTLLEQRSELVTVTTDILEQILTNLGVSAVVSLRQAESEDEGPIFEIAGDDSGLLIGRRGETLRALQFMVKFIAGRRIGERVNLMLDVEGYQKRRNDSLANLAQTVARRVATSGRSITLEPMPPNERRIVHITLSDHADVTTQSTGVGDSRKVVVSAR